MKIISMLVLGLFIVMLSACGSSAPPDDIVKNSVANMMAAQFHLQNVGAPLEVLILDDWEITNSYTKVVDNETGYLYEFQTNLKVKGWDGSKIIEGEINDYGPMSGTVALVKRGSKWYSVQ